MKREYNYNFIKEEKERAATLCTLWHVGDNAKIVNDWIDIYIEGMKEGTRLEGDRAKVDFVKQQLETDFHATIVHLEEPALRYLLARLLFYTNNELEFGNVVCWLGGKYVEPLIKVTSFSIPDFLFMINEYLAVTRGDPQNEVEMKLIKIAQKSNLLNAQYAEKYAVFTSILEVLSKRGWQHHLKGFKTILKYISSDDLDIIAYLKNFHIISKQGCYIMLNTLLNYPIHEDVYTDFAIKRRIIEISDTARGAKYTSSWESKALELIKSVPTDKLKGWCDIMDEKGYEWTGYDYPGWTDAAVKRFRKAALWISQMMSV
ncbi:MAG: hypothetical protein Q4D56_10480 [Bacteroides sp.]|nr:hypothetical protein [Bacteroides sp.]